MKKTELIMIADIIRKWVNCEQDKNYNILHCTKIRDSLSLKTACGIRCLCTDGWLLVSFLIPVYPSSYSVPPMCRRLIQISCFSFL